MTVWCRRESDNRFRKVLRHDCTAFGHAIGMISGPWLFQRDILNNPQLKLHPEASLDEVWQPQLRNLQMLRQGELVPPVEGSARDGRSSRKGLNRYSGPIVRCE